MLPLPMGPGLAVCQRIVYKWQRLRMGSRRRQRPCSVGVDGPYLQVGWVKIPGVVLFEVGVVVF